MTEELRKLINLILESKTSSMLLSGDLISQPEKIGFYIAQAFLSDELKINNSLSYESQSFNLLSANSHPDFKVIERSKDRTQIQIQQIRDAANFIYSTPLISRTKIVIIPNADQLNFFAQDTLLKSLEEPPKNLKFILTTSKPYKLKPTVLSRLIHYKLNPHIHVLSSDLINQIRQEIDDFASDLARCNSSKKIEKIASKWDDSNLSKKLNWLSKIIRNSIFLKINQGDLKSPLFIESISYLANSKSLIDLFELSNELNYLIDGLAKGVNLNNKLQIKALLSSY